jgi:branched-chain amino acid transport system substrate-binding protein
MLLLIEKRNMTKPFGRIISIILLACLGISPGQAEDLRPVVKIGAIVPLTGDMALHGVEIQRAMNLAVGEFDPGRLRYRYSLIFEDNQLDGAKSVSAAQRLINVEGVDAVVTLWPPTASVVIPISERADILHYTISWDPDLAKHNKLVLSHQAMVDSIARSTMKLLKSNNKSKVAFLHMEETGFNLGAKYVRQAALEEGVGLVADEAFNPQETDFRSLIARLGKKSPDAYLIWAVMPSIDIIIQQIKSQNPKAFVTGYLDYAQNSKMIQGTPYVSEMFASTSFIQQYRRTYGEDPASKGPNAYDITKLLISAFERSPEQKPSAAEIKTYLTTIRDFPGAVGQFSIDRDGNSTYSPVIRKTMEASRVLVGAGSGGND